MKDYTAIKESVRAMLIQNGWTQYANTFTKTITRQYIGVISARIVFGDKYLEVHNSGYPWGSMVGKYAWGTVSLDASTKTGITGFNMCRPKSDESLNWINRFKEVIT